jgi:hypothetical protein
MKIIPKIRLLLRHDRIARFSSSSQKFCQFAIGTVLSQNDYRTVYQLWILVFVVYMFLSQVRAVIFSLHNSEGSYCVQISRCIWGHRDGDRKTIHWYVVLSNTSGSMRLPTNTKNISSSRRECNTSLQIQHRSPQKPHGKTWKESCSLRNVRPIQRGRSSKNILLL